MAGTTDFVPFATGGGANVTSQADYIAEGTTSTGYESGVASSADCNKTWRQGAFQAAVVATFVANQLNINVPDDGNLSAGVTNFGLAIKGVVNTNNAATATLAAGVTLNSTSANANLSIPLATSTTSLGYSTSFIYNPATGLLGISSPVTGTSDSATFIVEQNGGQFLFLPSTLVGAYNPITGAGDSQIVAAGTCFTLIPYGAVACGVKLRVTGVAEIHGDGGIGLYGPVSTTTTLNVGGALTAVTGNFTSSDPKLKEDFAQITSALAKALALRGGTFTHKLTGERGIGLLSTDVEAIQPEAIGEFTPGKEACEKLGVAEGTAFQSVNYGGLTAALMVEALREVDARLRRIEAKLFPEG